MYFISVFAGCNQLHSFTHTPLFHVPHSFEHDFMHKYKHDYVTHVSKGNSHNLQCLPLLLLHFSILWAQIFEGSLKYKFLANNCTHTDVIVLAYICVIFDRWNLASSFY